MSLNIFANARQPLGNPAFLLGAAAAGFAVGLVANLGRKAAVQSLTALKGQWDEGLKAEHRLTMTLFDALEATDESDVKKRKALLVQLQHALAKHAFEEENVVYPAMRDHGQIEDADKLVHDHGYVKQYLFDLSEMDAPTPPGSPRSANFAPRSRRMSRKRSSASSPASRRRSAPMATNM